MSSSAAQIDQLFAEIDRTPWGPHERALVDEAVRRCVEAGDIEREYAARMRLTSSANQMGDTDTMLSSFAWCVSKHDDDPARFPAGVVDGGADLYWHYKWMAGTLARNPIFPVEQIRAVLVDMEERYRRAGIGRSGVLSSTMVATWTNGWLNEAAAAIEELARTERDDYSNCEACGPSLEAEWHVEFGDESKAITLVEQMIEEGASCGEEPERAIAVVLLPYLRAGRFDDAKAAHLRSYRDARGNADNIGIVANHLVFCAITGNEARGLAMLERHIAWLAHDPLNRSTHFYFLCAMGLLLDAVTKAGHGQAPVRGAEHVDLVSFFGSHDGSWAAGDLAAAAWSAAERLGDEFDQRNGNDYRARQIEASRSLASEHYDVPLHSDAFPVATVATSEPEPTDAAGWLTRARELAFCDDAPAAIRACRAGLEMAAGRDRTSLLGFLIASLVIADDLDGARAVLPGRIEALRAVGDNVQADLERRVGLHLFGTVTVEDLEVLEAELATTSSQTPPFTVADLAIRIAIARLKADQVDVAMPLVQRAVDLLSHQTDLHLHQAASLLLARILHEEADPATAMAATNRLLDISSLNRAIRADALRLRATQHGGAGDFVAGLADVDAAIELDLAMSARARVIDGCMLAAALLNDLDREAEGVGRVRMALQQAELAESDGYLGLRYALGRQLVMAGHGAEGLEVLTEVFGIETDNEAAPGARGETLYWMGHGLRIEGEYGRAVSAWEHAIELYAESEDFGSAANTGIAQGRLFMEADVADSAVESFREAWENAQKVPDNLSQCIDAQHWLGRAQCSAGDSDGIATLDQVIGQAREMEAEWLIADVSDSRGRGFADLGRLDEAIPAILSASDLYVAAGDERAAAFSTLYAARALSGADRAADAVPLFRSARDQFAGVPNAIDMINAELGDVLEGLGRHAEAAETRAAGGNLSDS